MVRKGFESKIIKSISVNIAKNILDYSSKIGESLEKGLKSYRGRSDFDETKYIELLKLDIVFYKYSIRDTEILLSRWIENKKIPSKHIRDKEIQLILDKSKEYMKNAKKSHGKTLDDTDKRNISLYENIERNELIYRLEKDHKVLNVYSDVLNIFMHHIEGVDFEVINYDHVKDVMSFIRKELIKSTNYILKSFDDLHKVNSGYKSPYTKLEQEYKYDNILEVMVWLPDEEFSHLEENKIKENLYSSQERYYLECVEDISYETLIENMENTYEECCQIEGIKYSQGFKFGSEAIKEYISSIILLDLVGSKEQIYLKSAIRLTIIGELGAKNFADFVKYIILKHIHIRKEVYNEILSKIEEKNILCLNHDLSSNQIKDSKYIDLEEYFFIIKNSDYNKKFGRNNSDKSIKEKIGHKCILKEKIGNIIKWKILKRKES